MDIPKEIVSLHHNHFLLTKNFRIMEAYAAVLIVYWVVIALLTKGQKLLEQRINKFMGVK